MTKVTVKALIDGGKAIPGPPLGPALAAHKVNIGQVIAAINEKTKDFSGMQVPIEVEIEPSDKSFKIKVGTPPTAALIKKEIKVEKLAKTARKEPAVGDLTMDAVPKITHAKFDVLGSQDFKKAAKEVVASCLSIGVTVEGKNPKEILKEINEGKWDSQLKQ